MGKVYYLILIIFLGLLLEIKANDRMFPVMSLNMPDGIENIETIKNKKSPVYTAGKVDNIPRVKRKSTSRKSKACKLKDGKLVECTPHK